MSGSANPAKGDSPADAVFRSAAGTGSYVLPIPPPAFGFPFYSQFACLDAAANPFGVTMSNYGRVFCGL